DNVTLTNQNRGKMSGICIRERATLVIVESTVERRVLLRRSVFVELAVQARNDRRGRNGSIFAHRQLSVQRRLHTRHQQCGRDTFAGDIANNEGGRAAVQRNEIVIVPADDASRMAYPLQFERLQLWYFSRKQLGLYLTCDLQLRFQLLLFLYLNDQLLDALSHVV